VRATVEFKVSATVTYKSNRCEYCRPKVCFEDALLETYRCERFLGFWSWVTTDEVFSPFTQPLFLMNCTLNDPLCNCPPRVSLLPGGGGREEQEGGSTGGTHDRVGSVPRSTHLLAPAGFSPDRQPQELEPKEAAALASRHVEGFFKEVAEPDTALGLLTAEGGVNWLTGPRRGSAPELTLLSRGADLPLGGALRVDDKLLRLPVLAVGPCIENPRAQIAVETIGPTGEVATILDGPGIVNVGRATTIWADIDLSKQSLKPGTRGNLRVTLFGASPCALATLVHPFYVGHSPAPPSRRTVRGQR